MVSLLFDKEFVHCLKLSLILLQLAIELLDVLLPGLSESIDLLMLVLFLPEHILLHPLKFPLLFLEFLFFNSNVNIEFFLDFSFGPH